MFFPKWKTVLSMPVKSGRYLKKDPSKTWEVTVVYTIEENRKGGRRAFEIDETWKKSIPYEYLLGELKINSIEHLLVPYSEAPEVIK